MALINFFYGNDIPCSMAVQVFHACNDTSDALMSEQFFYFYDLWQNSEDGVHLCIYFNMRVEKFVFINGSRKDQLEIVEFQDSDIPRGFGNKDTEALQEKIEQIRSNVPYY